MTKFTDLPNKILSTKYCVNTRLKFITQVNTFELSIIKGIENSLPSCPIINIKHGQKIAIFYNEECLPFPTNSFFINASIGLIIARELPNGCVNYELVISCDEISNLGIVAHINQDFLKLHYSDYKIIEKLDAMLDSQKPFNEITQ